MIETAIKTTTEFECISGSFQGLKQTPLKFLIHGAHGVGKSTFCAGSPDPFFLDIEGNVDHLKIPRVRCETFEQVIETLKELAQKNHGRKTLVVDALDTLEQLIWLVVCREAQTANIEDAKKLGFGRGYVLALSIWNDFLNRLDVLRNTKNMNILLVAHSARVSSQDELTGEQLERIELRIQKKAAGLISDWMHCIAFAHIPLIQRKSGDRRGGQVVDSGPPLLRVASGGPWVAKNIFNLPSVLPLDWGTFEQAVQHFFEKELDHAI